MNAIIDQHREAKAFCKVCKKPFYDFVKKPSVPVYCFGCNMPKEEIAPAQILSNEDV